MDTTTGNYKEVKEKLMCRCVLNQAKGVLPKDIEVIP